MLRFFHAMSIFLILTIFGLAFAQPFIQELFARADFNNNGELDLPEISAAFSRNELPLTPGYEFFLSNFGFPSSPALAADVWIYK